MDRPINAFLLRHGLRIARNPCISPDFCLDWRVLRDRFRHGQPLHRWPKSGFRTAAGAWMLAEDLVTGDCTWLLEPAGEGGADVLDHGMSLPEGGWGFPATWGNLLKLKNLIQEHDPASTIFPTSGGKLGRSTLGVGARFTTLHWPAVEWAMSALELGVTANQNSIPRELVYDTDVMLAGKLDRVPFPFIGTSVPEGHQGQSVEGMSHGAVLSKLKTGFHRRRIAWSFNADHQPIGGAFDAREDALVRGCLLASYITFDLSPELALHRPAAPGDLDPAVVRRVRERVATAGLKVDDAAGDALLRSVWPAMKKMQRRDEKYRAARAAAFTTDTGRRYLRELSIDELPGLTTPETTAVMLALANELGMPVNFVAPAFGFQKNTPYPDNAALRSRIEAQWAVCREFGASLGFHSGSGKSAENYRVIGEVTGGCLEIKTSGRFTYEMAVALARSEDEGDQQLWRDWYRFTLELAVAGAFSADATEQTMARRFVAAALEASPPVGGVPSPGLEAFSSPASCRAALAALPPSPDHMFFFEYNFLYVLAAGGKADKAALGDHTPDGYEQRARFYAISPRARLYYAQGVAAYLIFLAEHTGLVPPARCAAARKLLARYASHEEMIADISH